jgi:hypothetical protein
MVITGNTLPRGIFKPCGARHRILADSFLSWLLGESEQCGVSSMHRQYKDFLVAESASADHRRTTNFAVLNIQTMWRGKSFYQNNRFSRLSKGPNDVALCCGYRMYLGQAGIKLLGDAPRCVGSMYTVPARRIQAILRDNRLACKIGTSSLHAVFKLRFKSSEYTRHTPSSGRRGEFKPVGVKRTPGWICLIHRCAPHPNNLALQECPWNVQDIQNYPENAALSTPATCLCLLCCNKAFPDELARIFEAGSVQA